MDAKIQRLISWASGHPAPPVTIECHITNHCNLNCRFCWLQIADPTTFKPELSHERFLSMVAESAEMGALEWRIIGGGEPLVRKPTAAAMMHEIKVKGMYGMLTTNGVLLDESLVEQLVTDRWDAVTFSLDGPDAETHDYLRGKAGAFQGAYHALLRIRDDRSARGAALPEVRFHTVLCTHNVRKLERMIDLAAEVGAAQVLVQPMTIYSKAMTALALTEADKQYLNENLEHLLQHAGSANVWTNLASMREQGLVSKTTAMHEVIKEDVAAVHDERPFLTIPCYEPWYLMLLRPDGLVTPCNKFDYDGDDGRQRSLSDIWYGEFFTQIRQTLTDGNLLPICATCCVGGILENRRIREQIREALDQQGISTSATRSVATTARESLSQKIQRVLRRMHSKRG